VLVDFSPYVAGPRVNIDDRGGARAAAQHLVDLGHRRIGLVVPFDDGAPTAALAEEAADPTKTTDHTRWRCFIRHERLVGWREPLVAAGIDWASVPVGSAPDSDPDTGYRAAVQLLDRADRPTAIICLSDVLAFGVMRAAAERGIRIPQDLSVVGYDDVAEAASAALTTIYQPHAAKGEEAVRLLTEGGEDVVLPTELVVRASSGPAPS
jgi:DNA-binding LacI/PurR family transcriptional regulator